MGLRAYALAVGGSPTRLSDVYGGAPGVRNAATDIPYRELILRADGPVTVGSGGGTGLALVQPGAVAASAYAQQVVADGASRYWRLNESSGTTAIDQISGASGAISGGVALNQPGAVAGDTAMTFDGTGKIVVAAPLAVTTTNTVEAWVKFTGPTLMPIWSNRQVGGVPANAMQFGVNNQRLYGQSDALGSANCNIVIGDGQWHYVAWVIQGANTYFYVDGVLDLMQGAPFAANTLPTAIGFDPQNSTFFTGSIDDLAIYPLVLTPAQIAMHHTLGLTSSPYAQRVISDGASHYWRLNEPSGTSAADLVGGAPGTISGGVTLAQPGALVDADKAMTFNGTTGRVLTTALTMVPPVTVEAWIKTSGNNEPIWGIPYAGGNEQWTLDISPTGVPYGNLINAAETLASAITGVRVVNDGSWHHVALRVQSAVLDLYIDGAFDKTAATTFPVAGLTRPFDIGHFDNPVQWWSGTLDEVAIYPVALTPAQIAAHYALRTATAAVPGAVALTLGPFTTGPLKLSDLYASGAGATLSILGVPY